VLAVAIGAGAVVAAPRVDGGLRRSVDPAQIVPIEQLAPDYRAEVVEVIRDHHFHQQSKPDTFPSNPKLYLSLLNEPVLTLALWKDLSPSPAQLQSVRPGVYQGTDGAGTSATWEYALRSPKLHVLFSRLQYSGPRGNTRLEGRIVLVVRSGFYREVNGETWVQHDIEAFVKVDSRGWRTVAATARPIIEKLLEDQVQEAGWFISLMARMVEMYPAWAVSVAMRQPEIPAESREGFRTLVAQTRRPNARAGRPQLADVASTTPATAAVPDPTTLRR
jgi:hypothetical protein